jgi:CRISPR-associated protein Cmr1
MMQVTFTLRTLTPLFLAGADQNKAELRPPAFRGLMRYWHRALVGGIVGTNAEGLKKVIEEEAKVFGTTERSSIVTIRTSIHKHSTGEFHREGSQWSGTGQDYLFWSMEQFGNKPRRRYFPQGTEFQVTLSVHGNNDIGFKQAIAAFWLLAHLGGIGSRSRRCGGSISAQPTEKNITELPFDEPISIEALQTHLKCGIEAIHRLYMIKSVSVRNASFDVLARDVCRIWILHDNGEPWHTAKDAMNALGFSLQECRKGVQPLWKRKIFGLPLKNISGRQASPLLLRVTKLQGEQYVGIAVLFKTEGKGIQPSDYKLIEDQMDIFPGRW